MDDDQKHLNCPLCGSGDTGFSADLQGRVFYRCVSCRVIFLDPAMFPDRNSEYTRYQNHHNTADNPGYCEHLNRLATPLLKRLKAAASGLDYGCGPGPVLAGIFRSAGHKVNVYDPLFFPDESVLRGKYDFISCTEVVEHFHHPAEEFKRMSGLLKDGGILAVMTSFYDDSIDFANWYYVRDTTHVTFYSLESFTYIADKYGWTVETPCRDVVFFNI